MNSVRRALVAAGVSIALAGGLSCVAIAGDRPTDRDTSLVFEAVNPDVGRARYELRCDPAGGDVPQPSRTCAAIERDPVLITDPKPFTCLGGRFSWWRIYITGRFRGDSVQTRVDTCMTAQMRLIDKLGIGRERLHLLPRRTRTLHDGERATYRPDELEPGDRVVCLAEGKRLEFGIAPIAGKGSTGWAPRPSVWLSVERRRDGSVHAECNTPEAHSR